MCLCIDLDGFRIRNKFIVRELGWSDGEQSSCFHYTHDMHYEDLSYQDKKTVNYARRHVHGLTFRPNPQEHRYFGLHSQDELEEDLAFLYELNATRDSPVVAYKGGQLEKDLLNKLNIPSVNLETLGCPKYDELRKNKPQRNCGCHRGSRANHCSMAECRLFMEWYNVNQLTQELELKL